MHNAKYLFSFLEGREFRGKLDGNQELIDFCLTLEKVCVDTVEGGQMTKDLALLIHKENMTSDNYLNTQAFLNAIKENLEKALA